MAALIAWVKQRPYFLLSLLFFISIFIYWPGRLTVDGQNQYAMAMAGEYHDHHPFIMSLLWYYFAKIYPGPGTMFLFHLTLFYLSLYFLMRCLPLSQAFWVLIFPFVPVIAGYTGVVLKDVGMTYALLCASSYLGFLTVKGRPLSVLSSFLLLCLIAYADLVKFQARYIVPLPLLWMVLHLAGYRLWKVRFFAALSVITLAFYSVLLGVKALAPPIQKDHAWQRTKLYDLAGISLTLKRCVIPEERLSPSFSLDKLEKVFTVSMVDPLFQEGLLSYAQNAQERKEVFHRWIDEVIHHPLAYLKHRWACLESMLTCGMKMASIEKVLTAWQLSPALYQVTFLTTWGLLILVIGHLIPVLMSLYFLYVAWRSKDAARIPLFFFNAMGLGMVFALLFAAMSASPRYTYITACFAWCSLPFVMLCRSSRS
jgi:hypothetical protein